MPITFTSRLTTRPVHLLLSGGTTLRLSPGQTSREFPDREAEHNPQIDRLRQQGYIDVQTVTGASRRPKSPSGNRKTAGQGRKTASRTQRRRSGPSSGSRPPKPEPGDPSSPASGSTAR